MKAILQRVEKSEVKIGGEISGSINNGLLILLGIMKNDTEKDMEYLIRKIVNLRIFEDENQKMNKSVLDTGGGILVVSQFTLCADVKKGNRPGFDRAARPEAAENMYNLFIEGLKETGIKKVETGVFGAMMDVSLINSGPVTIIIDSRE